MASIWAWDSKATFLGSRAILAVLGFARTVLVVRLLTLDEYALIGIVEALRSILETLFGLAISDSLAREAATEKDKQKFDLLVSVALVNSVGLGLATGIGFVLVAAFSQELVSDARLHSLLGLAFVVGLLDRLWIIAVTVLQVSGHHRAAVSSTFIYGVAISIAIVCLVWSWGVFGYLFAQVLVLLVAAPIALHLVRRVVRIPSWRSISASWRATSLRLWTLSWSMYVVKGSGVLWRRVPILLLAPLVPQHMVGVVSATLDLTNKVHLIQQALSPLVVPRLSRILAISATALALRAKTELFQIGLINLAAFAIGIAAWLSFGAQALGVDRWSAMDPYIYVALLIEATLVAAHVTGICVLIPTRSIGRLSTATVLLRISLIPAFLAYVTLVGPAEHAVFASLLVSGTLVAGFFLYRTMKVLQELGGT